MSYIGNVPTTAAFPFDQFSGNGTTTSFTLTYSPASATSIIVTISGVVQNPNLYSVSGNTLTFAPAPPTGTNNIAVLYLGLPVIGTTSPGNTAYFSSSSFTATAGQTTFTPSGSYQVGFVNVIRNGSQLAPADYTATNGTTVTLNNPCVAGDIVVIEVFNLVSIANALPLTGGTVTGSTQFNSTLSVNGAFVSGFTGFKNRIINPGMVIDQRNNGASVTPISGGYTLDRWAGLSSQASKFTVQRNAGSVTPPAGFSNYLGVTVASAANVTIGAGDYFNIYQWIEGFNIADLAWGTASAAPVTLSFRVYSSLTGTFGGALQGITTSYRSYPFTYTVSAANTWTTVSITVPGDTSSPTGGWPSGNTAGLLVAFSLGAGSTYLGAANSWNSNNNLGATGQTNIITTNNATFYITGVQLERGSNATSFEFRDYGRELMLCQRYYYQTPTFAAGTQLWDMVGMVASTTSTNVRIPLPVVMRATPSVALNPAYNTGTGWQINLSSINNYTLTAAPAVVTYNYSSVVVIGCSHNAAPTTAYCLNGELYSNTGVATNYIQVSAEL